MCLRPLFGNTVGKITDEPVKCYKAYYKEKSGNLRTLVAKEVYEGIEGDVITAKENVEPSSEMSIGFIHAYKEPYDFMYMFGLNLYAARIEDILVNPSYDLDEYVDYEEIDDKVDYLKQYIDTICLCEMEIPVWERHWEGVDGDICAKRMILKKRLVYNKSDILKMIQGYFHSERPNVRRRYRELIEKYKSKGE